MILKEDIYKIDYSNNYDKIWTFVKNQLLNGNYDYEKRKGKNKSFLDKYEFKNLKSAIYHCIDDFTEIYRCYLTYDYCGKSEKEMMDYLDNVPLEIRKTMKDRLVFVCSLDNKNLLYIQISNYNAPRFKIESFHDIEINEVPLKNRKNYLVETSKRLQEKNYKQWLFHVGDFKRKSEDLKELSCGRSTGFFGTGYYFCSEWELCANQGGGHRPLYCIDASRYNLMCGTLELHEALKDFNKYMSAYQLLNYDIDKEDWWSITYYYDKITYDGEYDFVEYLKSDYAWYKEEYPMDTFLDYIKFNDDLKFLINVCDKVKDLKDFVKWLKVESPNFEKVNQFKDSIYFDSKLYNRVNDLKRNKKFLCIDLGVSESQFDKICDDIYSELEKYYEDGYLNRNKVHHFINSFPTMFVKALGYDGIIADKDCDNISIGTCIFDIDSKDIEYICDDVSEFDGNLSNLKEL